MSDMVVGRVAFGPARTFVDVVKDLTVSSVHTPTALGNEKDKRKGAKDFKAMVAEAGASPDPALVGKRVLHPNADGLTAKSPFRYDPNALGSLRPDQVPRFFGALTDSDKLPAKEVKLADLHAMQDRVDPAKVEALRGGAASGKLAVVVRHDGKEYIADGHHRLTADWLNGKGTADVRYKDLEPVDQALKRRAGPAPHTITIETSDGDFVRPLANFLREVKDRASVGHSFDLEADRLDGDDRTWPTVGIDGDGADYIHRVLLDGEEIPKGGLQKRVAAPANEGASGNFRVAKVDDKLGIVFGWAIVCKIGGQDYYDLNVDRAGPHAGERVPEHIPESVMLKAASEFMQTERPGNDMHEGPDKGQYVFAFPLTTDVAKAMGLTTDKTGLMVGFKPPADILAKYKSGEYTGFSIEGRRLDYTEHAA